MGVHRRMARHAVGCLSMHHIWCPDKRRHIEEEALHKGITGLYLYGKPGRVVAEGTAFNLTAYERGIRRLHWQKCRVMGRVTRIVDPDATATAADLAVAANSQAVASPTWLLSDPDQRLFDSFMPVDSEAELSKALSDRGLTAIDQMLRRGFSTPTDTASGVW